MAGNQPVFERGVTLSTSEDDGSVAFDHRFRSIEATGCLVGGS